MVIELVDADVIVSLVRFVSKSFFILN